MTARPGNAVDSTPGWQWYIASLRYSFAYLSAAFLVSAPLRLILDETEHYITFSLIYGVILGVGALIFLPFGDLPWGRMTVPRFKLFELGVTRNAAVLAALLLAGRLIAPRFFPPPALGSIVFLLMLFSYLKAKVHTYLFRDFYRLEDPPGGDRAAGETEEAEEDKGS